MTELSMLSSSEDLHAQHLDFGSRARATPYRQAIEAALESGTRLTIDFCGVEATQSFVDELIGVVVLERGPSVIKSVSFRGCSDDMKAILRFVLSDRVAQFEANRGPVQRRFVHH